MAMFHMSNDSHLFKTYQELKKEGFALEGNQFVRGKERFLPLYEAKMVYQYNHRHSDFSETNGERAHILPSVPLEKLNDSGYVPKPFYWVPKADVQQALKAKQWDSGWLIGWRDVTDARASARTLISTVIPSAGVNDKYLLMLPSTRPRLSAALLGNLCSMATDYVAKQKVGGLALKYFTMKQLPILSKELYSDEDLEFIVPRVLELTYTAKDMKSWAKDLGYEGPPFGFDPERRMQLRAELDAYYARLYQLTREELQFVLEPESIKPGYPSETFAVLKRSEMREFGEYRTQRLVLEAWDKLEQEESTESYDPYRLVSPKSTSINSALLPDLSWQRLGADQRADTSVQLIALLKAANAPMGVRQVRLAAALAMEPRLMLPLLDEHQATEWQRLIGDDARPLSSNVLAFASRSNNDWGAAVRHLRTNGYLLENQQDHTWAPDSRSLTFDTPAWADGRANWVLNVLRNMDMDALLTRLPEAAREWINDAA